MNMNICKQINYSVYGDLFQIRASLHDSVGMRNLDDLVYDVIDEKIYASIWNSLADGLVVFIGTEIWEYEY